MRGASNRSRARALCRAFSILVLWTATAWAQTVPAPDLAKVLAEARASIDAGRAQAAVAQLSALDDTDPRVRQLLGVALYHADDHRKAVAVLEPLASSLAEGTPERAETEQVLGLSLFLLGRYADAVPWLERTRKLAPDSLELGHTLGQAYIYTRQPDAARAAFARTFGVAPDAAAASVVAAQMMLRLQAEALAEGELERALALDPKVLRANYLLGQIALFRGQLDEALARSRAEIALNPSDAMAYQQIGDAYVRQSRWDAAIAALQRSLWLNPFYSGPYILLGRAYMKKGQPGTAESMLRRAIEYDPNNRAAHYLLAQLLQQVGREDEAKREFEIAERLKQP
jgi:tetratricopeptide (TPR) repeat protein